jgi:hypothetical protein
MNLIEVLQDVITNNKPRFVENGEHIAYITKVESRSNEKGTNWIVITCDIDEKQKLYVRYFFTEKTAKRSFRSLLELVKDYDLEFNVQDFDGLDYMVIILSNLIGERVLVEVSGDVGNQNYKLKKIGE